jgi:hypothetical protein
MAAGTAKLTLDLAGKPEEAEAVAGSYLGATAGKLIDHSTGSKTQLAEKTLDLAEGFLLPGSSKPLFGSSADNVIEGLNDAVDGAEFFVALEQSAENEARSHSTSAASSQSVSVPADTTLSPAVDTILPIAVPINTLGKKVEKKSLPVQQLKSMNRSKYTQTDVLPYHPNSNALERAGQRMKHLFK